MKPSLLDTFVGVLRHQGEQEAPRETERALAATKCPHCETPMARVIGHHLRRCVVASEEERAFYRSNRVWPPIAAPGSSVTFATMPDRLGRLEEAVEGLLQVVLEMRKGLGISTKAAASKGGKARAANLPKKRRVQIAKKAANARWH